MAVELRPPLARMARVSGFAVLLAMNGLAASSGEKARLGLDRAGRRAFAESGFVAQARHNILNGLI